MNSQSVKYCANCGGANEADSKYCAYCGSALIDNSLQESYQMINESKQDYSNQQYSASTQNSESKELSDNKSVKKFNFFIIVGLIVCCLYFKIPGIIAVVIYLFMGKANSVFGAVFYAIFYVIGILFSILVILFLILFGTCLFSIFTAGSGV